MGEGDDESSVEVDFGWWLREAATFELCNSARPQARFCASLRRSSGRNLSVACVANGQT